MKDIKQKLLYLSAAAFNAAKTKYKGGTFAMASDSAFVRDLLAEVVKAAANKKGVKGCIHQIKGDCPILQGGDK